MLFRSEPIKLINMKLKQLALLSIGFMWLAKLLYPDYTREIDLEKETREFFREFYRHELTDEEYRSFFGREPAL